MVDNDGDCTPLPTSVEMLVCTHQREPPYVQVLDFGWIDTLPDGTPCLGNWWPDGKKFPQGLKPLSDQVHAAGMLFGIHMALPQVQYVRIASLHVCILTVCNLI